MNISQIILNSYLSAGDSKARRLWRRLCLRLLDAGIGGDVHWKLNGFDLLLPAYHPLPRYRYTLPEYNENLGRIAAAVNAASAHPAIIDIGANIGDTIAVIRAHASADCPTLAIEGNAEFLPYLKRNVGHCFPDVQIAEALVGAEGDDLSYGINSDQGTARLEPTGALKTTSLLRITSNYPAFTKPSLIKIDTDGFDARIILGNEKFIRESMPVLFFEYDPSMLRKFDSDGRALLDTLRSWGYGPLLVWDHRGDFAMMADLGNSDQVGDIHRYFCGGHRAYADLAAFPSQRHDVASIAAEAERRIMESTVHSVRQSSK